MTSFHAAVAYIRVYLLFTYKNVIEVCFFFLFSALPEHRKTAGKHHFRAVRTKPERDRRRAGVRARHGVRPEKVSRVVLAVLPVQPGQADMHVGHGRAGPAPVARHQQPVFRHAQGVRQPRGRLGTHEPHV